MATMGNYTFGKQYFFGRINACLSFPYIFNFVFHLIKLVYTILFSCFKEMKNPEKEGSLRQCKRNTMLFNNFGKIKLKKSTFFYIYLVSNAMKQVTLTNKEMEVIFCTQNYNDLSVLRQNFKVTDT